MAYLAIICVTGAVIVLTISLAMIATRLYERSRPFLSQYLGHGSRVSAKDLAFESDMQSTRFLWRMTAWLGRPLMPFVTWGQRRRLTLLLSRAGFTTWEYVQIYCLQCVFSFLTLTIGIYWLNQSLLDLQVSAFFGLCACASLGWWCPVFWLKRIHQNRLRQIAHQFPFFLDMVGLGLDAGLNLQASIQLALEHVGKGALHQEWSKMLADMRAGQPRALALRQLSQRLNLSSVRQLISSLIHGESMGFSLGRIIQVYADQQRTQRLMQAEKLALQAPVKMLFPMALCIFPCTFIILGFPVVVQLMGMS
jgi:tight adherence protein C